MDPFSDLPRITQQDLLQRAANFANEMVRGLQGFNESYHFWSLLTKKQWQKLKDIADATYPAPEDMRTRFEEIFLSYMKDIYVIIPDP